MSQERRRYYRIEEVVMLSLSPIDSGEIDRRLDDFWSNEHEFSIRNNYNFQIAQHIADRQLIENRMPELGRYLRVLEQQIDRLTEYATMRKASTNLSAQGIAYYDDAPPPRGELVEFKLKLLPSGLRLVIIARVVKVDEAPEHGGYRISLDFEHMHEADREILIKHIHGKQMEALSSAQES